MKAILQGIITAAAGGLIVAIFVFFYLSDRKPTGSVQTTYHAAEYGSELAIELSTYGKKLLEAVALDIVEEQDAKRDDSSEEGIKEALNELRSDFEARINWKNFASNFVLGRYGYLETIKVQNQDDRLATKILIEGRDVSFAVVESSSGDHVFEEDFDLELKLLPDEVVKVLHVVKDRSIYSVFEGNSQSILVSMNGEYILPINRSTLLDDMFGASIKNYPFLFFMLCIIGLVSTVIIAGLSLISLFPKAFRELAKASDEKSFAMSLSILRELKVIEPEKYSRIVKRADVIDSAIELPPPRGGENNKP